MKPTKWALVLLVLSSLLAGVAVADASPTLKSVGISLGQTRLKQVLASDKVVQRFVAPPKFLKDTTPTATISVTYTGFSEEAKAAFQHAVDIWSRLISSSVPIRIKANWTPLATGVLGNCGPTDYRRDFSGAPQANVWYPVGLADKLAGFSVNGEDFDIEANFNSSYQSWYLGTDGQTPNNKYDFVSVVLHELCHGLGFIGSMTVSGGLGSWGGGTAYPFIYDKFVKNGAGVELLNTNSFPNGSQALAQQLTGGDIYFTGTQAIAANNNSWVKLYAPNPFRSGSSFSHLDEVFNDTGNSLMTYSIGFGEAIHSPGEIPLAMFTDMGWSASSTPAPPTPGGETFQWGSRQVVCCTSGAELCFTATIDGTGLSACTYGCDNGAGWNGYASSSSGQKTVYFSISGCTRGSTQSTSSFTAGKCYYFEARLVGSTIYIYKITQSACSPPGMVAQDGEQAGDTYELLEVLPR